MSLSKKGKKKKPFTEEHKENIRKARLGAKASPEAIENMKKAQKIRANSEEGKRKTAEIMRKRYEDPAERLKLSLRLSGENAPNYGKKMSDKQKAKISNTLKGRKIPPEVIEKRKISLRKAWAKRKENSIKMIRTQSLSPASLEENQILQH